MIQKIALYISLFATIIACGSMGNRKSSLAVKTSYKEPVNYSFIVQKSYPHSTTSYTQGLQIIDGQMWESTGINGASRLMKVELESGKTEVIARLENRHFGEGLTVLGDSIFYLTWMSERAMVYNRKSGKKIGEFSYHGEGWGLTSDGTSLYMSNGTAEITVRNPRNFSIQRTFEVTYKGEPLTLLNELEWIEGKIWANVYTTNFVAIIEPQSGVVEGVIDFTGILPPSEITEQTDYLNGIAYDEQTQRIFVTGKNWSKLFHIDIIER